MAEISTVTVADVDPEGDWICPGGDTDDIEFRTVGLNDDYRDTQAAKHRRLAKAYQNDVSRVPMHLLRKANMEALLKHCVFGVKNLTKDGAEVSWEDAKKMLLDPRHKPLATGAFEAAKMAEERLEADMVEAEGNSARS